MIVQKTSLFPAERETVFRRLQQLETLQYIARPYATFEPVGEADTVWTIGSTSSYRLRLFGVIPFATHTIHIVRFDAGGVCSREGNEHVPVWNHDIRLEPVDALHTRYTDRVEIRAGWKTPLIWLWANAFYAHRQRKWVRLFGLAKRIPGLFMKISLRSFGPDAGFGYEFPESRGNVARFNIVKCPYYETCVKYGCGEITRAFCDGDDAGYGSLHPKLLWGRTKTIGRGGDCCDFRLEYTDQAAAPAIERG